MYVYDYLDLEFLQAISGQLNVATDPNTFSSNEVQSYISPSILIGQFEIGSNFKAFIY